MPRPTLLALLLCLVAPALRAQDDPLRVGVIEAPPFAMASRDGAWMGMAVDMWRVIAEGEGWPYELVPLDPAALDAALADGGVDLALPVQATPAREAAFDLSLPLYTATLGLATPRQDRLLSVLEGFLSWQFLRLVLGLSILLLIVGAVIWALERRRNDEQFAKGPLRGLGDGFWWAGVTLTTIGYGDKAPITLLGRAVAMLWMLTGLAVSAALTAAVVTMAGLQREADVPEDLRDRTVAVVDGSSTATFLQNEGIETRAHATLAEALEAAEAGRADVAAGTAPLVRHALDETGGLTLSVRTTSLDPQMISIALPEGSGLAEPVNGAILRLFASEIGWRLTDRYTAE
ncbi:ion channel [Wenxinia marina]|uniref:ABC-type amino acid transport/signal transduction system, periplasmic component/domain protein n=1 Tax=Wenxinia marina DSM 24838 TaxID=1123501 RepID=A0A0D0NIT6_9RHOB|nr:transporter substrate-binding domain-containing protein [Wenxinia marina]KIQ68205.1 ABC-type amino acid transport/signal transduction system, periplasmic component/domain protein [Wenxinia marina DSM 24838]GGL76724.1 hypothetical protein GCM10011392_33990 [Wenxinia marina]